MFMKQQILFNDELIVYLTFVILTTILIYKSDPMLSILNEVQDEIKIRFMLYNAKKALSSKIENNIIPLVNYITIFNLKNERKD